MIVRNSIYLKEPTIEELKYTEMLLADPETMKFNEKWGGTVLFPKEKWESFYKRYIEANDKYYFHIYNLDGVFVGEVSARFDTVFESYVLNIKVMHRFRGNNHGYDALDAFLTYLFEEQEISRIVDNVGHDSIAGIKLLKWFGFIEIDRTEDYILLELKKENF